MLLTPDEITALVGTAFVYEVPMIRYRQYTNAPGTLRMYQDRFEWRCEPEGPPQINVPYEAVETLRVSAPDKPKVQIQACIVGGDHINFLFADSNKTKEQLLVEQGRARDQLQKLLVRYKKLVSTQERNITQSVSNETDAKRSLLKKSWLLKVLYTNLVVNNVMAPDDFWKMYYKPHEKFLEQPGVSNGFMFEVAGDVDPSGIRMNLTPEIIRQIYKTYPIVERKYIENVPHNMSAEDFWSKFFQSHYFNRDRIPDYDKNNPFKGTLDEDEAQIEETSKKVIGYRKEKDLLAITEGDGLYSELPELFKPAPTDRTKLIRRLNDFSDRILEAGLDPNRTDMLKPNETAPTSTEEPMEVDNPEKDGEESEGDEIIADDDPIMAYESYVQKPGVPENPTAAKAKELPLTEDNSNSDAELALIEAPESDNDEEVVIESSRIRRDVSSRFRKLGLQLDLFDGICDEITASLDAEDDDEDDSGVSLEDVSIVRRMQHEYVPLGDESAMPQMSASLVRQLFCTHTVVFELSAQARKLMRQKTDAAMRQAFTICIALQNFRQNHFDEVRRQCYEQVDQDSDFIEYLDEAIDSVVNRYMTLKGITSLT
uniref:BSD domain-containing protein n=1 Tax=Panagrellus redivivus TaxID=6233 RepID=A0A7E4V4S6_PANRE